MGTQPVRYEWSEGIEQIQRGWIWKGSWVTVASQSNLGCSEFLLCVGTTLWFKRVTTFWTHLDNSGLCPHLPCGICLLPILAEESDVIQSELTRDFITSLTPKRKAVEFQRLKNSQMVNKNTLLITLLPKALDIMPAACYLMFKGKLSRFKSWHLFSLLERVDGFGQAHRIYLYPSSQQLPLSFSFQFNREGA